jgi:hypothetical protein
MCSPFWGFAASGAGRRRPEHRCDRMVAAEAARRRKTGRTEDRPTAGRNPPGILSLDTAINRGTWINLSGAHAGRERGSPPRVPSFDNPGGTHGIGADRDQHFALLWIRRPVGANTGSNGDDGDHTIVSLFLVCIGVQIAWNGIKALLESLTLHIG